MNDLWYAMRALRKSPGFALAAIITLAVAIAADCVVFSVADAVLFRPLPYWEPDRLVNIFWGWQGHPPATYGPSIPNFLDWKRRNNVFEDMALTSQSAVSLKIGEYPESATAIAATTNLFDVLGVKPLLGRTFSHEEGYSGRAEQVAMLSYDFWQSRFHGDPNALGKQLSLDDGPRRTVVGVLPAGFKFTYPKGVPIWTPLATDRAASRMSGLDERSTNQVTARLKPGITPAQAEAGMRVVLTDLAREYPFEQGCTDAQVISIRGWTTRQVRSLLFTLLGAVTFVLLIGCANVANLALARMTDRERETTVRAALGAARWRLVRGFLAESLLVALAAGALGLLLSGWGLAALRNMLPPGLPRGDEVSLDGRVAWFALAVSLATTVAFGLLPALGCSKINLMEGLTGSAKGMGGRRGRGVRASLVVAETALALVLAAGAGLMMNSFIRLMRVDLGFNPKNVLAVQVVTAQSKSAKAMTVSAAPPSTREDAEVRRERIIAASRAMYQTNERTLDAVRSIPGVRQASYVNPAPLLGGELVGPMPGPNSSMIQVRLRNVTGDYFGAMRIPLLAGRVLTTEDTERRQLVTVLNQSLARFLFPNGGAVGKYLLGGSWLIVGVVADSRNRLLSPPEPELYQPDIPTLMQGHLVVRYAEAGKANLNGLIREKLSEIEPGATVSIDSYEEVVAQQGAQMRFLALLFAGAGALGLLLAASGVFGVTAYSVNRRTRELGVRMAIGAAPGDVLRMIVREAIVMAFAGAAIGTAAVFALRSVLRSLLFEVQPGDPLTLIAVIGVLAAVTVAASYVPARRVLKIDPAAALRHE